MSSKRYVKTAAGHAEIQSKSLALPRPVRNLLLVINDSQPGAFWLQQIRGLVDADLSTLLEAGLIAEATAASSDTASRGARRPEGTPAPGTGVESGAHGGDAAALLLEVQQAIADASYSVVYDALTAQAGQLGLMKGYRLTLEIERAADLPGLQSVAWRIAQGLKEEQGIAALGQFLQGLRGASRG